MIMVDDSSDQEPPSGRGDSRITVRLSGCPGGLNRAIRSAARRALASHGITSGEVEVAVVDDAEMARQHARWMGDQTSTDVLTFDLRETPARHRVEAQLIVCETIARREAESRDADWRAELVLYVVHGCLHLCGHDDHTRAQAARMHAIEDEILTELGWGPVFSMSEASSKRRGGGAS